MKVGFFEKAHHIEIKNVAIPEPGPGEVRIALKKVGVCGSDLSIYAGKRKMNQATIIGHEGFGLIDCLGSGVKNRYLGERVAVEPYIPCGTCRFCNEGRGNICPDKRVIGVLEDGCFAEYICLPEAFCWSIPEGISDLQATAIEPLAVGFHALKKSSIAPGQTIAVIGLGAIGMLLTHLALRLGYKVIVTEPNAGKTEVALGIGAMSVSGSAEELNLFWEKEEVVGVFECAGSANSATLACHAAPRGSVIVLLGISEIPANFIPLKITREGITILPSIIYDHPHDFEQVIDLLGNGVIDPTPFITSSYTLDDLQMALDQGLKGDDIKIVIDIA